MLLVAASRESGLVDYANPRARFMIPFGDGAAAALLGAESGGDEVLGCHMITDGSYSIAVKVPAGGSVEPASDASVSGRRHYLDVDDPAALKRRLDRDSLARFVEVAHGALAACGLYLADVGFLCALHLKPSMQEALVAALGLDPKRVGYLDDTGHMSGVDPLFALDRARRAGELTPGEVVLLLAAGTGYTWAASILRIGTGQ